MCLGVVGVGLLAGCDLFNGVQAGTILGEVDYNGRPASGIMVTLQSNSNNAWVDVSGGSGNLTATTNPSGVYEFDHLKAGQYRVRFQLVPVTSNGAQIGPKEVGSWTTNGVSLGGGGARLPAFDVAYNGLIYPESGKSNAYTKDIGLPFHWSTHLTSGHYQVDLYDISGGGHNKVWTSGWTSTPVAQLTKGFQKGNYQWQVELDGGSAGAGTSESRNVDLDFQTPDASSSAP